MEYRDLEKRVDLRGICDEGFPSLLLNECEGEGASRPTLEGPQGPVPSEEKNTLVRMGSVLATSTNACLPCFY